MVTIILQNSFVHIKSYVIIIHLINFCSIICIRTYSNIYCVCHFLLRMVLCMLFRYFLHCLYLIVLCIRIVTSVLFLYFLKVFLPTYVCPKVSIYLILIPYVTECIRNKYILCSVRIFIDSNVLFIFFTYVN